MMRALPIYMQTCLLAVVTLALLTVPFAHSAGAAPVTPQMTQFLAMGGNITDICGETGGHINAGCESCRTVGEMLFSSHAQTAQAVSYETILLGGLTPQSNVNLVVQYTQPPVRGPPHS